tara:strand:- start:1976 stop:2197 length:222 start_codon:yes stop_codon:yes gene_type:complete
MNILPRLDGNVLKFFNTDTGANHRTVQLPSNATYSGPIVSGETVSVTIHFKNSNDVIRIYNLNTGRLIRSISM